MNLATSNALVLKRLSGRKFPINTEPNHIIEFNCHYERHNYGCDKRKH